MPSSASPQRQEREQPVHQRARVRHQHALSLWRASGARTRGRKAAQRTSSEGTMAASSDDAVCVDHVVASAPSVQAVKPLHVRRVFD